MPEPTSAPESQADNGAPHTAQAATTTEAQAAEESISLEKARELRAEAAGLRKRLKDAEGKNASYETERLTEGEKLQKRIDELTAANGALLQATHAATVASKAATAGALYPEVVARQIPDDTDDIDKAVADLKKRYPALFGGAASVSSADGGARGSPIKGDDMNSMIRRAAGRER